MCHVHVQVRKVTYRLDAMLCGQKLQEGTVSQLTEALHTMLLESLIDDLVLDSIQHLQGQTTSLQASFQVF